MPTALNCRRGASSHSPSAPLGCHLGVAWADDVDDALTLSAHDGVCVPPRSCELVRHFFSSSGFVVGPFSTQFFCWPSQLRLFSSQDQSRDRVRDFERDASRQPEKSHVSYASTSPLVDREPRDQLAEDFRAGRSAASPQSSEVLTGYIPGVGGGTHSLHGVGRKSPMSRFSFSSFL